VTVPIKVVLKDIVEHFALIFSKSIPEFKDDDVECIRLDLV
jgi:hypothetical protein